MAVTWKRCESAGVERAGPRVFLARRAVGKWAVGSGLYVHFQGSYDRGGSLAVLATLACDSPTRHGHLRRKMLPRCFLPLHLHTVAQQRDLTTSRVE